MSPNCVICDKKKPKSKAHLLHCGGPKCRKPYQEWAAANWDLLPAGPWREKHEERFYEVTPEQREQFARFFELQRPLASKRKARKCLKCGDKVSNRNNNLLVDYRLCGVCRVANNRIGALAQ